MNDELKACVCEGGYGETGGLLATLFEKTKPILGKGKSKKAKGKMKVNPEGLFEKTKPMSK
jgi:hypothetical protein